jgi:serine/threonine protein kinase
MGGIITNTINKDDFIFYQKLGKGEFGEVILIKHRQHSQYYAVKEINLLKVSESGVKPIMLQNELNALKRLESHPFITELNCSFIESEFCYIILDYLNGGSLRDLLSMKYSFTERQIAFLVSCIATGLAYIHSHGIIHRDIKPENIVLDCHGHPHIADFGISHVDPSYRHHTLTTDNLQDPISCRMTSGTEQYCAPECLAVPHDHGIEVDYWSLGIMTYELFFHVRPFRSRVPKVCVEYVASLRKTKSSSDDIFGSGFQTKVATDAVISPKAGNLPSPSVGRGGLSPSTLKYFDFRNIWTPNSTDKTKMKPPTTPLPLPSEGSHRSMTLKFDNEHSISFSFAAMLKRTNRVAVEGPNASASVGAGAGGGSTRVGNPSQRVPDSKSTRITHQSSGSRLIPQSSAPKLLNPVVHPPVPDSRPASTITASHNQVLSSSSSVVDDIVCPKCSDSLAISLTVPFPPPQYYVHTRRERPTTAFLSLLGMLLDIRPNHRIGHQATKCLPALLQHEWFAEQQIPVASLQAICTTSSSTAPNFGDLPAFPLNPSPLPTHLLPDRRPDKVPAPYTLKNYLPNQKLYQLRQEIGDFTFVASKYRFPVSTTQA